MRRCLFVIVNGRGGNVTKAETRAALLDVAARVIDYALGNGADKGEGRWTSQDAHYHLCKGVRHAMSAELGRNDEDHLMLAANRMLMAVARREDGAPT